MCNHVLPKRLAMNSAAEKNLVEVANAARAAFTHTNIAAAHSGEAFFGGHFTITRFVAPPLLGKGRAPAAY